MCVGWRCRWDGDGMGIWVGWGYRQQLLLGLEAHLCQPVTQSWTVLCKLQVFSFWQQPRATGQERAWQLLIPRLSPVVAFSSGHTGNAQLLEHGARESQSSLLFAHNGGAALPRPFMASMSQNMLCSALLPKFRHWRSQLPSTSPRYTVLSYLWNHPVAGRLPFLHHSALGFPDQNSCQC